jgi:hypothetical protein
MRNPIGTRGPIDMRSPVNWAHPLNAGLLIWILTTKNYLGGPGPSWLAPGTVNRPLVGAPLKFQNSPTLGYFNGWPVSSSHIVPRPGGFGCVACTNNGGIATCATNLNGLTNFTLAAWLLQSSNAEMFPVSNRDSGANNGIALLYVGQTPYVVMSNSGSFTLRVWGSTLTLDTWHHIVMTHVAGTASITMYVDGVSGGTLPDSAATDPGNSAAPFTLGDDGQNGFGYGGGIDDVRLYNRTLSAIEVQEYYRLSQIGYPGLVNRIYPQLGSVAPSGTPHLAQPYLTARIDPRFLQEREFI